MLYSTNPDIPPPLYPGVPLYVPPFSLSPSCLLFPLLFHAPLLCLLLAQRRELHLRGPSPCLVHRCILSWHALPVLLESHRQHLSRVCCFFGLHIAKP